MEKTNILENKDQNSGYVFHGGSQSPPVFDAPAEPPSDPLALMGSPVAVGPLMPSPQPAKTDDQPNVVARLVKRADVLLALLLILGSIGLVVESKTSSRDSSAQNVASQYDTTQIPLAGLVTDQGVTLDAQKVTINGSLVLTPTAQPATASAGQIYYDQTSNLLNYYNGSAFVPLGIQESVSPAQSQTQTQQTSTVTLTAGNGIAISGTTISNAGVISMVSGNSTLAITDDGAGNHVLTVNPSAAAGVASLNGLFGVLSVANATAAGSTVTIDDASTSAKGIAQFNASNFSVSGGIVNTIQNISTGASPTFTAVNTNTITPSSTLTVGSTGQQLVLQGNASTQLTATGGGFTTTVGFAGVPVGNVTFNFDRSVTGGTYDICTSVGNCAGSGTGVTSIGGGAANRLAKFTASQNVENSSITDTAGTVSTTSDFVIQGGDATIGVASSQTGTLNFAHSGSGFLGSIMQGALTDNRLYLLPDAGGTFCLTSGNCSGSGSSNTLQAAYDAGNAITATDNRNLVFTFADTATDPNMLINLECDTTCGANGRFAIQDDGTDIITVAPSAITIGSTTTNVPVTISSGTGAINIGNGAQARTIAVGTGAAAQTLTLGSTNTTSTTLIQGGSGNITLNSSGTTEIQDTTNIAGNLTVTGTTASALVVKASTNGSSVLVMDVQQSDSDSILRLTDDGVLGVGNSTNLAGVVAIAKGSSNVFAELRATNITASRILQMPDVAGTLCTDAGNCGSTTGTLQKGYDFSTGSTTPEIKLDSTRNGIEIQDADSTLGSGQNFLSLRAPNAGGLGAIVVGFGIQGNLFMQPTTDRTDLLDINTNAGNNLLTVDSVNSRVGIGLGGSTLPTHTLDVGGNSNLRGSTLGDALTVSNATSTGNVAVFKDNATTVASIADGGAATFQNSANSANALRVLDAAGTGEHMGVDTADSIVRLLANNTGHLSGTAGSWNSATALPAARAVIAAVSVNGYVYSIGGCDTGGNPTATVYYARANSDGTLGSWTATTSLPNAACGHAATTYNGYIYVHGSTGTPATSHDIAYAKPNADGTISSWTTQNDPTNLVDLKDHGMTAHNGYLYIVGGQSEADGRNRNIYYGKVMADGSVPNFSVQTNWLNDQDHNPGQATTANGYLYVMGSSNYDKFYYGRINADGTVAANALATGTTDPRKYASIAVMNGYMYAIMGGVTPTNSVQYGALTNSGDIGTFATDTTTTPATRWLCPKTAVVVNSYIYVFGCADAADTASTAVYYAGGSRVKVGGGLDLVGYSGEGMSEGGTGGQLTAGNTFINGALSVTGNTNLKDGATVGNALSIIGTASLQTPTNTTTGFQVLNASAVPQFVADTSNSRIYIGNPTADNTGALLVLDTKQDSGDPSVVNGGMYYNSNSGKLRCAQASAWTDCITTDNGVTSIGVINSQTKSANGAVISGNTLYQQTADASNPGLVSTGAQTLAGDKTLTGQTTVSSNSATAFKVTDSGGSSVLNVDGLNFGVTILADLMGSQGFEGVTFPPASPGTWTTGGNVSWSRNTTVFQEGAAAAASGTIDNDEQSYLDLDYTFTREGKLKFYWKVDSEEDFDYLFLCVDDDACTDSTALTAISGDQDWAEVTVTVDAGAHSFRWVYSKDDTAFEGADKGWIDNVRLYEGGKLSAVDTDVDGAFRVLGDGGVPQFSVDLASSRIYIGNPTADSSGAILVLDRSSSESDPSGVAGAMYYNTNLGTYRCFDDDWADCKPKRIILESTHGIASSGPFDLTGLSFPLVFGGNYSFSCRILYESSATNNGLRLGFTMPNGQFRSYSATIPNGADGTAAFFQGTGTSSDDMISATNVEAIDTEYMAQIDGVIYTSSSGTLQSRVGRGGAGSGTLNVREGSFCELTRLADEF